MSKIKALLLILALLLSASSASATILLVQREIPPACPGFFGCNFTEVDGGAGSFGALYDNLPVSETLNNGGIVWTTEIDSVDGLSVDATGDPAGAWYLSGDLTFTVDVSESYNLLTSMYATGTTDGYLETRLQDMTNGITLYHSIQESAASTVNLKNYGGGNVTNIIVGNSTGTLQPGIEYKYTFECGGANSTYIDCMTVPEPSQALLFAGGLVTALAIQAWRRRR